MDLNWTRHLKDPAEVDRFQNEILRSKDVLKRLQEIIQEKHDSIENVELSLEAYNNPNWAYRQAHVNGYKSAIKRFVKLLDLEKDYNERPTKRR
jgi:hypothetical protein